MMDDITPEELHNLLIVDGKDGSLVWRARARDKFPTNRAFNTWNSRYAGNQALNCTSPHGYNIGGIHGKNYRAHRVIWAMVHGEWPDSQLDHINRDKADNRISNLRLASNTQNNANRTPLLGSTSKYLGVTWHKLRGKWQAGIVSRTKRTHLGLFEQEEDAALAYNFAALEIHGEYANYNKAN